MTRIGRRYWRAYYRLSIRRAGKLRLAGVMEAHQEDGVRIRILRNHHGLDRTASLSTWPDDFSRARGWKDHKNRCQWGHCVRLLEKHERTM